MRSHTRVSLIKTLIFLMTLLLLMPGFFSFLVSCFSPHCDIHASLETPHFCVWSYISPGTLQEARCLIIFKTLCSLKWMRVWHWLLQDVSEGMYYYVQINRNLTGKDTFHSLIVNFAPFFLKIQNFIAWIIWVPLPHWRGK